MHKKDSGKLIVIGFIALVVYLAMSNGDFKSLMESIVSNILVEALGVLMFYTSKSDGLYYRYYGNFKKFSFI